MHGFNWTGRLLLVTCLYFCSGTGYSQTNHIAYHDSLLKILETQPRDTGRINSIAKISIYYDDDSVVYLNYCKEIISISEELNYKKGLVIANSLKGRLYAFGFYDPVKSAYYYTQSLRLAEEIGDKGGMAQCHHDLAWLDAEFQNYDHAFQNVRKAIALNQETGNNYRLGKNYSSMANYFNRIDNHDSALYYYRMTLQMFSVVKSSPHIIYHNMAGLFLDNGEFDSCAFYLTLSDNYYDKYNNAYGLTWNQLTRCDMFIAQGKANEALPFLESIRAYADSTKNSGLLFAVIPVLLEAYRDVHEYKKGFLLQEEWIRLNDSTRNSNNANRVLGIQMELEADAKAKVDSLQQVQKDQKATAILEKEQLFRNGALIALLLSLGIAYVIYRGFLQKKKSNLLISQQKHLVEVKQKEIVDSINYAKRLQEAILPPVPLIKLLLPDSFVLYLPKDIVAGDFYWMEKVNAGILFAVADCTGHGVPGAMVSVVCSNALDRAVKEFGITNPGQILDKVRELVIETFEKSDSEVMDGMDISLALISCSDNRIQWSGAHNPLWMHSGNEIIEVKADKQPVGLHEPATPFTTHDLEFPKGSIAYLFTDGYADQFGGEKGKKFRYKQLKELLITLHGVSMEERSELLAQSLRKWKGDLEQVDDICIVGIRNS